jgi:1,4-alpha-glucan branching enzyme
VVCNFTPVVREIYRIGLPKKGKLTEIFNSDKKDYGGSGVGNPKPLKIEKELWNGRDFSVEIVLPPLGVVVFKCT